MKMVLVVVDINLKNWQKRVKKLEYVLPFFYLLKNKFYAFYQG